MKTDKQKLVAALNDLLKAHKIINSIWLDSQDELEASYIDATLCELYPYTESFDELTLKVALWVASVNTDLSEV